MAAIRSRITLQDNVQVYAVVISGTYKSHWSFDHTIITTTTKNSDGIRRWIEGVYADFGNGHLRVVGLEVEVEGWSQRPITIQFCVGNRCLVIPLTEGYNSWPPSLLEFMQEEEQFCFVCTEAEKKLTPLKTALRVPENSMIRFVDLSKNSDAFYKKKEILNSCEGVLDLDWGAPHAIQLSPAQVHYACLDTFLNLHIAKAIWSID